MGSGPFFDTITGDGPSASPAVTESVDPSAWQRDEPVFKTDEEREDTLGMIERVVDQFAAALHQRNWGLIEKHKERSKRIAEKEVIDTHAERDIVPSLEVLETEDEENDPDWQEHKPLVPNFGLTDNLFSEDDSQKPAKVGRKKLR